MMRLQDTVKLSTRMFKTRPARTWLTILGIGVGISAVVVLVGLGFGLQGIILEKIVFGEAMLSLNVSTPPSKVVVIDKARLEEFRNLDHVDDVSPLASFTSLVTFEKLTGSILLQGVNANYFSYAGLAAKEGAVFKEGASNEIVVTTATLKLFEIANNADIIGKKVSFKVFIPIPGSEEQQEIPLAKEYTIIGVIDDPGVISAYIPLSELTSQFAIPYYEKARVKVASNDFLTPVEDMIIEKGFIVTALSKTVEQANKIFNGIQITLAIFGGIALVVSAIGMFNTMTVTLLERTNEIGIMRTIGGSPKNIQVLFLSESIVMGFLGGVVGIAIGVFGGEAVNLVLNMLAKKMGGTAISLFKFPITFLLFVAAFSGFMGFLTGVFPARRASSLNPLDAIRYK
jgi:ABC-type antimicrobial peptide transport system permease subunit